MANEPDLKALWAQGNQEADQYYKRVAPHLEGWASQRSHDLFARLRRYFLFEIIAGCMMTVALFFILDPGKKSFLPFAILFVAILLFSIAWYLRVLRRFNGLQSLPVTRAIQERIIILSRFIRHLQLFNWIGTPLGFVYGIWVSLMEHDTVLEEALEELLIGVAIGTPVLLLIIWLVDRQYIKRVYVPVLHGYQELRERLDQEETAEEEETPSA